MHSCTHSRLEIRWRNRSVGFIGRQCLDCGDAVGGWLKHADVADVDRLPDWAARPDAAADPVRIGLSGPMDRASMPRYVDREAYAAYLASETWKRRRAKVLERAGGVCEGCLTCPPTEVHHLTYRNVFAEFAFQLVALCRACHERVHSTAREEAAE